MAHNSIPTGLRDMPPNSSPPVDREVGERIREIRKDLSLSLQLVADRAAVSVGTLSQLERGLSQPSLRTLQKICNALGVPLAWLFRNPTDENEDESSNIVRAGLGARLSPQKGYEKLLLTPRDFDGLQMILVRLDPHAGSGPGAYTHTGLDAGYVLSGSLHLEIDGRLHVLTAGDSFAFSSTQPHRFENRGASAAEIVWVTTQSKGEGN